MFGEFISDDLDLDQCDISPASGYEAVRAQYTEQGEMIVRGRLARTETSR
jgi:hypothetical protein